MTGADQISRYEKITWIEIKEGIPHNYTCTCHQLLPRLQIAFKEQAEKQMAVRIVISIVLPQTQILVPVLPILS